MARLEQITDLLPKPPRTAIEGNFNAPSLRRRDGRPTSLFMAAIQMQQPHPIQHRRLKHRLSRLRRLKNDLPRPITFPHEDHRLRRNAIEQGAVMPMSTQNRQRRRHRPAAILRPRQRLHHALFRAEFRHHEKGVARLRTDAEDGMRIHGWMMGVIHGMTNPR